MTNQSPLGSELRSIRQNMGLLLGDVAEMVGVSAAFLSQIENGKKRIPDSFVGRIVSALKLGPTDQRRLERASAIAATNYEIRLKQGASVEDRILAHKLSEQFARLTPQHKQRILEIVTGGSDERDAVT